jgi:hypothetical protein
VVLVAAESELAIESRGHPCYRARSTDRLDVERTVRSLSRTDGAPVVVLLCGVDSLHDPGAIEPPSVVALADGLGSSAWLVVLDAEPCPGAVEFDRWQIKADRWTRTAP